MSEKAGGSLLQAVLSSGGAVGLFVVSWLVVGVPLPGSLLIGGAGYAALWLIGRGLARKQDADQPAIGSFVDMELARATVAKARASAAELQGLVDQLPKKHELYAGFSQLPRLVMAIAEDVQDDPKDAPQADAFVSYQVDAAARLLRLVLDIRKRSQQDALEPVLRQRLSAAVARLDASFRSHLAHLQEDNIAELQAELDVLEQGMSFDEQLGSAMDKPES